MDGLIDGQQQGGEKNALLKKWDERVGKAVKAAGKQHALYKKCRAAVDLRDKNEERKVNPYLIHSTLSALVPALYAKNPEIEVRPTRLSVAAQNEVSPWVGFAEVAEDLLQREFVEGTDLKRRAKGCLLSVLTTGSGWLKLTLQDDFRADPMQYNRINDAQDNVAEIEALQRELDEPAADEEAVAEALKFQTAHVEAALQGRSELFVQKGLVIDRVAAEDLFVLDDAVLELADYAKAEAIGQRVWMTAEVYKRVFATAELPKGAKHFGKDKGEAMIKAGDSADDCLLEVWEVWDKGSGHVFTFARGADDWAREPYSPAPTGERWYPFFGLMFNQVDGRYYPLSDVQTLIDYQEEYSHLRSQVRNSRQYNKPTFVVPKAGDLSAGDAQRLTEHVRDDESGKWIAANINPSQPISASIQQFPVPQLNHALFVPDMIFRDVEMTTRSGDAARGYVNKAKTATEAEIMSMGAQSGISERQDMLEDMMRDMARYALEIMVQSYTPDDVEQLVGAETPWQNMGIDVAFKHLALDIKAGSMSKPNKFQEREQWMQLMPVMQQTIAQMAKLHMQGQAGMAAALRKMLEETINRFDERIDLDEFIPDFAQDMMAQQMMQQQQMLMQQAAPTMDLPPDEAQQQGVM